MGFLFCVHVYVFIPMVLFLWLKMVKNCQKWLYMGIVKRFFFLGFKKLAQRVAKYTARAKWPFINQTKISHIFWYRHHMSFIVQLHYIKMYVYANFWLSLYFSMNIEVYTVFLFSKKD